VASDVTSARETGLIHSFLQPIDRVFPMVAAQDVGRVAADLIQQDWTGTRVIELEGPSRESPHDLANAFAQVTKKAGPCRAGASRVLGSAVPLTGHETPRTSHANAGRF
jgi:uncharacterized protein YbjT (DUF2867 family)